MTDPKVIEALEALNNFCRCLFNNHGALSASIVVREKIDALLAAAEKPAVADNPLSRETAAHVAAMVQRAIDGTDSVPRALLTEAENELQAIVDLLLPVAPGAKTIGEALRKIFAERAASTGDTPATPTPVPSTAITPSLPWVVRRKSDGMTLARCALHFDATAVQHAYNYGYAEVVEVAPAAPVVPVRFDDRGDALLPTGDRAHQTSPEGWSAEVGGGGRWLAVYLDLRGEDAGVTTGKILAAVGRGL